MPPHAWLFVNSRRDCYDVGASDLDSARSARHLRSIEGFSSLQRLCCIRARDFAAGMPQLEALVVGGSIGGLMAAHALLKAGCTVAVLERAPSVSSAGAVSDQL